MATQPGERLKGTFMGDLRASNRWGIFVLWFSVENGFAVAEECFFFSLSHVVIREVLK